MTLFVLVQRSKLVDDVIDAINAKQFRICVIKLALLLNWILTLQAFVMHPRKRHHV